MEQLILKQGDIAEELVVVRVGSNTHIHLSAFRMRDGKLQEGAFDANLKRGPLTRDELGRGNENLHITGDPRMVVILNFDRLEQNVQRSLLADAVGGFPVGHLEAFDAFGFVRTGKDGLLGVVDIRGGRPILPRNVAGRCPQCNIYAGDDQR